MPEEDQVLNRAAEVPRSSDQPGVPTELNRTAEAPPDGSMQNAGTTVRGGRGSPAGEPHTEGSAAFRSDHCMEDFRRGILFAEILGLPRCRRKGR